MILKNSIKHHYRNMEDITDADYTYTERVCKEIKRKKIGEYLALCVEFDTLLLADVFNNF